MKKEQILQSIINDSRMRRELVKKSHEAFCSIYLSHHITHPYAFFHKEMFRVTEKYDQKLNVFMAFRASGKSTILNLSNAIWSILGKHQKKFVLIISKSRVQSQAHFENIKSELEDNELLKQDLGPFRSSTTDWGAFSIELPLYNAKIMCIGSLQNIRGLKYKNRRPDLIICDDMEDIISVKEKPNREKLYQWFINEVMSIGDEKTNIVVLGNLLDRDSLMVRLKKLMMHNQLKGKYYVYPLLDDNNKILWPERYSVEDVLEIINGLPKKKDFETHSLFDQEYRLDMSMVKTGEIEISKPPISVGGNKREDFNISVPLWAYGVDNKLLGTKISDPDGWKR
jgi:hypothetical protein